MVRSPVNRHRLWQVAVDATLIVAAWVVAWNVRFDTDWPRYYDRYLEWDVIALVLGIMLPVFIAFGFYNRWWRYVSTQDMWGAVRGVIVAVIAAFVVLTILDFHPAKVPRSIWVIDALVLLALVAGVRLLARTLIERPQTRSIVARVGLGLMIRAGARKPDVSTVEAFTKTLVDARSITYASAGASGIAFLATIEKLGIAAAVKAKARPEATTEGVGRNVTSGTSDLAALPISEILPKLVS